MNLELRDGIAMLHLARDPVNAVDLEMVEAAEEALNRVIDDESCIGAVLTGGPKAFSAGMDVRSIPAYDKATATTLLRTINRMLLAFYGIPKPVVAAINGHCLGAGCVMAMACDVRIAAEGDYRVGLNEIRAGIPFPAGAVEIARSELSPPQARDLILDGDTMPPHSPRLAGLIDRVVKPDELIGAAVAVVKERHEYPVYGRVKRQIREPALARLAKIVADDDDPIIDMFG